MSINVDVVVILVGSNICDSKKFNESVSKKLFTDSKFSYFNKSILQSPRRKVFFEDSF